MSEAYYNIIKYIDEYGGLSLEEEGFNEVDSLILCQLSYLNYSSYVGGPNENKPAVCLKDIMESDGYEEIFKGYWYYDDNKMLVEGVASSNRFGMLKLNCYESVYNESKDAQFAAVTYILPDKSVYIAYRGTDATILGWKEDIKLAYSKPVRAQELATGYLKDVALQFSGKFRMGGHSKGGNLAVYAAMHSGDYLRDRMLDVYNHDGPGFRPEIINVQAIENLGDRIHKYIPRGSVVGIIMDENSDYEIIDSWGMGTLQHNTYNWKIDGNRFVRVDSMSTKKRYMDLSLNQWIWSLSETEVDAFVDLLYEIFTASDAKNLYDIWDNPTKAISMGVDKYKSMDEEKKATVSGLMTRLKEISTENASKEIKGVINEIKELWHEHGHKNRNT